RAVALETKHGYRRGRARGVCRRDPALLAREIAGAGKDPRVELRSFSVGCVRSEGVAFFRAHADVWRPVQMKREAVSTVASNAIANHPVLTLQEKHGARVHCRRFETAIAIVFALEKVERIVRHPCCRAGSWNGFPLERGLRWHCRRELVDRHGVVRRRAAKVLALSS